MSPLPNRTEDLPEKRYYDPSTEENWADILHSVLREISANSIVSGTDRDEYEPLDGQLFIHTGGGRWAIGDGSRWHDLGEVGSSGIGDFEGSLLRVTTAEQLETALEESNYIRITNPIEVDTISPIDIPEETCLYGLGTYRDTGEVNQSAKLLDNSDNPTLRVVGDDVRLFGFAVNNQSTGANAAGVATEANTTDISHLDVYSGYDGIVARPTGDSTPTNPRVESCRVLSETGDSNSGVGIRIDGQEDATVAQNTVAGFDTQIELATADASAIGNHTATSPATSTDVGIRVAAARTRVIENQCDGAPATAGIHVTTANSVTITENQLQVGSGADGIFIDDAADLQHGTITDNLILSAAGATGNLAINGNALTGSQQSTVRSNPWDGFNGAGYSTTTVSVGTDTRPSADRIQNGDVVRNTDDDSVWANLGGSVHELNREHGWEVLDIVEDGDTGTNLDISIDADPNYGSYLLAGYINGGATSDNAENTTIDININNNYDAIYDYATREQGQSTAWTTGATAWAEQVWSRGITPIAWRLHSGTDGDPSDADTPWTTIHSVCHQGRRGLLSGRDDRSEWRLHSVELYSEVPRFGGRFVLYGMDRDRVALR